jgi:hypothetical protein
MLKIHKIGTEFTKSPKLFSGRRHLEICKLGTPILKDNHFSVHLMIKKYSTRHKVRLSSSSGSKVVD